MILHILLFLIYSAGLSYALLRIPFVRKTGIRPVFLLLFFAIHVAVGLLHNIIAWKFYPAHGDIWYHFQMSFLYRRRLTGDIHQFIADNNTWTYFTHNGVIFINMVLDLFSADNLAINTLLFAFPVFLGSIALFLTFRQQFPNTPLAALATLLLPSTVFWTACIHREGILYTLIGLLCYKVSRLLPPAAEPDSDTTAIANRPAQPGRTPAPSVQPTQPPISTSQPASTQPNHITAAALANPVVTESATVPPNHIDPAAKPDAPAIHPNHANPAIRPNQPAGQPTAAEPTNPFITPSVYSEPRLAQSSPGAPRQYLLIALLIILISYFRIVVTLSLLPGLFIWWAAQKQWPAKKILLAATGALLLLVALMAFSPALTDAIIQRQHEFLAQESHSRLPLPALEHSWHSVAQLIPRAFINGLFQPLPGSGGQLIYTAFSIELLAIWAVVLFALLIVLFCLYVLKLHIKTKLSEAFNTPAAPFAYFCLTTSILGLLLIGCMIPAVGAIVRYRSIYLPLLLAPSFYILRQARYNRWLEKHLFNS